MTVIYAPEVATAKFGGFIILLRRWHGSIYKFIWKDFACYAALHYFIALIFYAAMDDNWKSWFEGVAEFCDTASDRIPVAFILGFYVTLVVGRFWAQLDALPWPSRLAVYVSSMIHDDPGNNRGRMIRRNIMRYLSIAYILTMRDICPPVRKRFKTFQDITEAGLLNEDQDEDEESKKKVEEKMLNVLSWPERPRKMNLKNLDSLNKEIPETKGESAPNLFYVPLMWAIDLVNKAYDEGLIKDDVALKALILEINNFRGQCGTMICFDWITVPLVYTQVVTIAVYTFFLTCLIGRQHLEIHHGDLYFPLFTFLEFLFIVGWLKVAENLLNPFGGDDDDFEINPLIETNLQDSFTIVDELHGLSPPLKKDYFYDKVDVDIPYTVSAEKYRASRLEGSATKVLDKGKVHCVSGPGDADDNTEKVRIYKRPKRSGESEQPGTLPKSATGMTDVPEEMELLTQSGD